MFVISGILLAAGRSQRMGQPKLLLPWHGIPLVRHVAQLALRTKLDELIVVTGHRAEHMAAALADLPLRIVHNAAFLEGQSTSLRAGIAAVDRAADAALILLADQPLLQVRTIDVLIGTYNTTNASIIVPRYGGRRGNPVMFRRALFPVLSAITGDQGARQVIEDHQTQVAWVDVADEGVSLDIDTPDAYQQLLDRSSG